MSLITSLLLGLGLSSAVGFRIFIPALITSIAAYSGSLELAEGMQWMGSIPALVTFSVATVAEVLAYYIPFVDNALDTVSAPLAAVCGSLLMGSTIIEMDPFIKWPVSIIAGGGIAATVNSGTSLVRLKSSGLTGGTANPVISTAEAGVAGVLSVVSIVIPVIAGIAILFIIYLLVKRRLRKS